MTIRKPLRVAVDARSLLCKEPRGEGKSLLRLYEEIRRQQPEMEIHFFGDEGARQYTGPLPPEIVVHAQAIPGSRLNLWENCYLPLAAWVHRCHVLHCTSSGGPRWSPIPLLLTVHDLIPLCFEDGHSPAEKSAFRQRLLNGLRNARHLITVSEHTRKDLLRKFPAFGVPVKVIHWGSAASPSSTSEIPPPPYRYFLAFGGEARRKNTDYTLERFIAVAQKVPEVKLVLVGINSTTQRDKLLARIKADGIESRVIMPGFVAEQELDNLLRHATALIYLSLYEGFGVPILEAIERGTPVIASDRTSIAEVLEYVPGSHALDQPEIIEQSLQAIISDTNHRQQLIEHQKALLVSFTWPKCATETKQLLEHYSNCI